MAGMTLGAASPVPSSTGALKHFPSRPVSSRTRLLQGVCIAGASLLSVHSSRQANPDRAVLITLHTERHRRTVGITSEQARGLALALKLAANAAEAVSVEGGAA